MTPSLDESVFASVFDVGVVGAGYAGFAAALSLAKAGKRVFLSDLRGDLLWESGRAFFPEAGTVSKALSPFMDCVSRITGNAGGGMDGAAAELTANELLRDAKLPCLYYAALIAVERENGLLASVIAATGGGLRRLSARLWIDATEAGSLVRLLDPSLCPRPAERLVARILFQRRRWPHDGVVPLDTPDLQDTRLVWEPSCWSCERSLRLDMPGTEPRFPRLVLPALKAAHAQVPRDLEDAYVSHLSFEPYPVYAAGAAGPASVANVAVAVPALASGAVRTLADRYQLGLDAVARLEELAPSAVGEKWRRRPVGIPDASREDAADVVVAGLGTGGAIAAVAAARAGAKVLALDPLSFAGGIGVGGGIPEYYWGCDGGLQSEIDAKVRERMPLFAGRAAWPRGFHPDVKRIVLDELLDEAGVRRIHGAMLASVGRRGDRVESGLVATPGGPVRIKARAWIDATGNGDLCAFAQARFLLGRPGDGKLQAYTQSCGRFRLEDGRVVGCITNRDAGFTDPTDSASMTRARIEGIHTLSEPVTNAFNRVTHVAPLLGVRHGRRIGTDYLLTLDDLFERRRFADVVGYTGSHYDNHSSDYELESDEAFFYVNCAGLWWARTACEIPYRMLLPRGLSNVWIACRAAGVSGEAVHSFRMQRDIQRIGEVCGTAAALAIRRRCGSRAVPYALLRGKLEDSGALPIRDPEGTDFGKAIRAADLETPASGIPVKDRMARCLEELRTPAAGTALWDLYRNGKRSAGAAVRALLRSRSESLNWRAAMLLAAWGDAAAEPRLLRAVARRETGLEADAGTDPSRGSRGVLPRWWAAVTLLRLCGGARSVRALERMNPDPDLPLRVRSAVKITLDRLAIRQAGNRSA